MLGNAAYHADHLREAADLLWDLARQDSSAAEQSSGTSGQDLAEPGGIRPGKTLGLP